MTLKQLIDKSRAKLAETYGDREAEWLTRITIEYTTRWNRVDTLLHAGDEVSDFVAQKTDDIVNRIMKGEPIQYIIGSAQWHGLELKVTPDVLIPRAETSELVDIITDRCSGTDLRVLDICTGSGCIAVALASSLKFARVTALDISEKALEVAAVNSAKYNSNLSLVKADALGKLHFADGSFDLIVSNPPYVLESEKKDIHPNVLEHEPWLALFVPDNDPLKFFRPISAEAYRTAAMGAKLFFEINPSQANAVKRCMETAGWTDVEILLDIHGRKRFACGSKR